MDWLLQRFAEAADTHAFVHQDRIVSYGDVVATVGAYQDRLIDSGVAPGETVVVLADYSPEVFCLILALSGQRNVIIPLTRDSVVEEETALGVSGCHWFARFSEDGTHFELERQEIPVENPLLAEFLTTGAPGLVLFSSGSTGAPKAILHDLERVAEKFRRPRAATVAIPFLMLDHFGGINTLLAITSSLGTVVTVEERTVDAICRAIAKWKVELLPATPTFLTLLVASSMHRQHDLGSLKRITYGTEVMPPSTLERVRKCFPNVQLQQTYGLSEVGVLHSRSRDDGSLWVKMGGEGFETRVDDGILWIRSSYRMIGYLNAPSDFDEDGWFNTRDRVEVDGDYFRILGRDTDIINVGGQKVYPVEVEDVILPLENIRDVAVFAEAHPLIGQIVVARVVLEEPEGAPALKARIRKACKQRLAAFKVPAKVVVSSEDLHTARHKKTRS